MRGVYQATFLATLAERLRVAKNLPRLPDVGRAFDLIVGTSTGGIVACALAAGVSLEEVIKLYKIDGGNIFPYQALRAIPKVGDLVRGFGFGSLQRGERALRSRLEAVFHQLTIGSVYSKRGVALALTAIDLNRHKPVVFKTNHMARLNGRDDTRLIVDVCMATTAAPILRSLALLTEPGPGEARVYYVDGGLWANNPGLVGLVEASELLERAEQRDRPIELFMLGSLPSQGGELLKPRSRFRTAWGWRGGLRAVNASLNAQATGYDYMVTKLAGHRCVNSFALRFPAQCPSTETQRLLSNMDDARERTLNALTSQATFDVDLTWADASPGGRYADRLHGLLQALESSASSAEPSQKGHTHGTA